MFQLRWLKLKRIDAAIPIFLTLTSNHLIWNLSQIILGRKINFSPLYIVFSKLTLNESQTFFENHLTFTLRQQIKALHNFKNSQSLLSGVTHLSLNRKLVGSENRFSWVRSKVDGPNGWKWSILKLHCRAEMNYLTVHFYTFEDRPVILKSWLDHPVWIYTHFCHLNHPLQRPWIVRFDPRRTFLSKTVHFRLDPIF